VPLVVALLLAAALAQAASPTHHDDAALRRQLESSLRRYFAADDPHGPELREVLLLARGQDALLDQIVASKSFVEPYGVVARHGMIDAHARFVDTDVMQDATTALLDGPAADATGPLAPLVVYVPDVVVAEKCARELATFAAPFGRFVLLVPDDKLDDRWDPTLAERLRHVGPLRDFLLRYRIDPDRVTMTGTGRGGHATWDVGLLHADRFAALFPCNGTLFHEGGYRTSGGVFLDNAASLAIWTVYNTTFDHGIEGCRYAAKRLLAAGVRFEAREESIFRALGVAEAMVKLEPVRRDPHPREIVKRFNHIEEGDHFWLQALDRVPREWDPAAVIELKSWPTDPMKQREAIWDHVKGECAFLSGSIRDQRVTLSIRGVGHLRVWFDPALFDYGKRVTLVVNGKPRPPIALESSAAVMLEHVHRTGDTARRYWASCDVAVDG
jgi:hypothetical protein